MQARGMTNPQPRDAGRRHPWPAGVVFRRLYEGTECVLAAQLIAACGLQAPPAGTGPIAWFGLWDLAAAGGERLVGAAVAGQVGAETVRLYAVAVPPAQRRRGVGQRMVREVADALRSDGSAWLVAGPVTGNVAARRLLHAAGFRPTRSSAQDSGAGWLGLEL